MFPPLAGEARKRGQEGVVGLRAFVDATGTVTEAIVARSTGHKELDELALATAYSWKLRPGSIDGVATPMWHCFSNTYYLRNITSYQVTPKDVEEMTKFFKACDEDLLKSAPGGLADIQAPRSSRSHPLPQPPHPPESIARGEQGIVGMLVYVNESGKVTHARIAKSTGYKILDDAALSILPQWQLQPGTVDAVPTPMWGCFSITFSVNNRRPYQATAKDREEMEVYGRMCREETLKLKTSLRQPQPG